MKINNLKVVAASLCLGVTLLTGCGEETVSFGNSKIVYNSETKKMCGTITFEDLNKYVKVVVIEENGVIFNRLLLKQTCHCYAVKYSHSNYDFIQYIDLETGAVLICYEDYTGSNERKWEAGQELNIISETGIISYLANGDYVMYEYDLVKLLEFYKENVSPTLDNDEKELIK